MIYHVDREAWNAWNEKEAGSWANPKTRNRALATIYGANSHWGRIEEAERLRLQHLNQKSILSDGPDKTPLETAKAVYELNKISLLIKTNIHSALLHEKNVKKVVTLLEQARAGASLSSSEATSTSSEATR